MINGLIKTRLAFALNYRRSYFYALAGLLALIALDWIIGGRFLSDEHSWWKDFWDPIVSIGTLLTAVAVWWEEVGQDWRNGLPKRLTVEFTYQGRVVMRCENARLVSEGDIRAFSQQIGAQMADSRFLEMKTPDAQLSLGSLIAADGGYEMHYAASFDLTTLPDKLSALGPDQYLCWRPPFGTIETLP
jgi:hypothetical protein